MFFVQDEIVLRTNLPIEKHASEVYTRPVYELFVQAIHESEPFVVEAVIPNLKYTAWHPSSETREKWSRVEYEVNVREDGEAFMCVCKQFEHTGMLCCHAVKVTFCWSYYICILTVSCYMYIQPSILSSFNFVR